MIQIIENADHTFGLKNVEENTLREETFPTHEEASAFIISLEGSEGQASEPVEEALVEEPIEVPVVSETPDEQKIEVETPAGATSDSPDITGAQAGSTE